MDENGRLVLTIKYGEPLKIGDAEIIVKEHSGQQIKVIVTAPKSVKIFRSKIVERILKQNKVLAYEKK